MSNFQAPQPGSTFGALGPAPTPLGKYRVLSPTAGVRVSPLCLGAMSIGDAWATQGMGAMDKESSFRLLDAFFEAGGNFVDTANAYQDETSEAFLGEWMEARGIRDQIVIATKYTTQFKKHDPEVATKINYGGNNSKSLRVSVDASLKKLRTSYIDLLYVHWWDYGTSIEEVMNNLHKLVMAEKVLYLGISDTPAWIVSKANQYARDHGKTPFSVYQGRWNVLARDFERDIIPMARAEGLALAPWDVLARGHIRTDAEEEERRASGERGRTMFSGWERDEAERRMAGALERVMGEVGAKSIQAVAIAYLMMKTTYVFPIVGGRKVEHLMANIEALTISLSPEQMKFLEGFAPFNPGFPFDYFGNGLESEDGFWIKRGGDTARWPQPEPIRP
ncbi:unnamed protein product [Peniophora sp. CBMAI 1063]|nr:unnamed protein product [Peniophora sp. CBMAI 1063]